MTSTWRGLNHLVSYTHCVTEDTIEKEVSVSVDGQESRLIFVDHAHGDMSVSIENGKIIFGKF